MQSPGDPAGSASIPSQRLQASHSHPFAECREQADEQVVQGSLPEEMHGGDRWNRWPQAGRTENAGMQSAEVTIVAGVTVVGQPQAPQEWHFLQ